MRDLLRFEATSFALWLIILFHANSIGVRDDQRSVAYAAPTAVSWSTWGTWSACNTLDIGRQTRLRKCVDSKGRTTSGCVGLARRTRQCESCAYPLLNPRRKPNSPLGSPSDATVSSPTFRQTASKTAWCSSTSFSSGAEYLEIAFKNFVRFTAIGTRGYKDNRGQSGFIKEFKIMFSYDGVQWFPYTNRLGAVVFKRNVDSVELYQNKLESALVARYIRVYPTSYHSRPCLDVELYGCEYNCGGLITDDAAHIKAPSAAEMIEEPNCMWRIESQVAATKLELKFPYFKLLCRDGVVEILHGGSPFLDAETIEELCGESRTISPFDATGGELWVRYHSNATTNDVGFELQTNTFAIRKLNSSSGEIRVPETEGSYAHIYRYLWLISNPQPNVTIQVTIHHFTSDNKHIVGGKCVGDLLAIHDSETGASLLGRYCDDNLPQIVNSTRGHLRLKFRTKSYKPNWKLRFSYKILGASSNTGSYTTVTTSTKPGSTKGSLRARDTEESPTSRLNDTNPIVEATQLDNETETSTSNVPVIISSVLAVVIGIVFLVALVHYLRRRKEFQKKHPYDCSNRPMSHFGDEDSTPFLNTNVLMWSDSNSRSSDKENKPKKNALPIVTVALREDGPQRLSIIPPEMLRSNSEKSLEVKDEDRSSSLAVSDAFTEECMQLLNNNLYSVLHGQSPEKVDSEMDTQQKAERLHEDEACPETTSPELKSTSPEVETTSPEVEESSPETDELLPEVSE